jgi:hypothetical protein
LEKGFYVTDFGAKTNDTSADVSIAFNNAELAACAANSPSSVIYIPQPNSYYLWSSSNPLHITCSGTRWIGLGSPKIWYTNSSLPECLINDYGHLTTGLRIENLAFETNQSGIPYCLYLKGIAGGVFRGISFPKELNGATGFLNPIRVESDDTHLAISNVFYDITVRTYCSASSIGVNLVSTAATVNNGITTEKFFGGEIDGCQGIGLQSEGGVQVFGTIFEESPDTCVKLVNPTGPGNTSDNIGSYFFGAYFEGCSSYTINYAGSRVYWNGDVLSGVGTNVGDRTARNVHWDTPYSAPYSERIIPAVNSTTLDVSVGSVFYTQNTSSTTYTNFVIKRGDGTTAGCQQGREITIYIGDSHTTIANGGSISNQSGANYTSGAHSYACISGAWIEYAKAP